MNRIEAIQALKNGARVKFINAGTEVFLCNNELVVLCGARINDHYLVTKFGILKE